MSETTTLPSSQAEDFAEKDIRDYFTRTSIIDALEQLLQELEEKRPRQPLKWLGIGFIRYYINNIMKSSSDREGEFAKYEHRFKEMAELEQSANDPNQTEDNSEAKEQPNTYFEKEIIPTLMNGLYDSIIDAKEAPLKALGLFLIEKNGEIRKESVQDSPPVKSSQENN